MGKSLKPVAIVDEYSSVSVRKIDNGYIVSKSYSKGNTYRNTETYSPTKPTIGVPFQGGAKGRK